MSGDIEDWEANRRLRIGVIMDLRRRRPVALFNEVFAAHVAALPPRRASTETL